MQAKLSLNAKGEAGEVEDKAKDEDEVQAMDKDVVVEQEEMRKIILTREETKIFQDIM